MRRALFALCLVGMAGSAWALDYRSVGVPAAILYDSPSQMAKKLYLIKAQTPVEVVVRLDGWVKIRDVEGTLAWIESSQLNDRRTLVVTAPMAELHKADNDAAPVIAKLEKFVAVDLVEAASPGWVKVHHSDGLTGYIRSTQVWGL